MGKDNKLYKIAILRKVNAIISLVCTFLILVHGSYDALWMILHGKIKTISFPISKLLFIFVFIHSILSILTAILGSGKKKKENGEKYKKGVKYEIE